MSYGNTPAYTGGTYQQLNVVMDSGTSSTWETTLTYNYTFTDSTVTSFNNATSYRVGGSNTGRAHQRSDPGASLTAVPKVKQYAGIASESFSNNAQELQLRELFDESFEDYSLWVSPITGTDARYVLNFRIPGYDYLFRVDFDFPDDPKLKMPVRYVCRMIYEAVYRRVKLDYESSYAEARTFKIGRSIPRIKHKRDLYEKELRRRERNHDKSKHWLLKDKTKRRMQKSSRQKNYRRNKR